MSALCRMQRPMPLPSPPGVEPLGPVVLRPHASHRHVFGNAGERRDFGAGVGFFFFFFSSVDSADLNASSQMQILHEPKWWVFYERETNSHQKKAKINIEGVRRGAKSPLWDVRGPALRTECILLATGS